MYDARKMQPFGKTLTTMMKKREKTKNEKLLEEKYGRSVRLHQLPEKS